MRKHLLLVAAVSLLFLASIASTLPIPRSSGTDETWGVEKKTTVELFCTPDHSPHQNSSSCNVCLACCQDPPLSASVCSQCVAQKCNSPSWPSPAHTIPKIVFSPPALHTYDWHDVAGAITKVSKEDKMSLTHHVFMGAENYIGGWAHFVSNDFVSWHEIPGAPRRIDESYDEMTSFSTPCAGFLVEGEEGEVCAGFRQCGSSTGVAGMNPWDVPLEVRCSHDENLSFFEDPIFLFNFSFYRGIPYDPARPWKDDDGRYYLLLSSDGCNDTTRQLPCMDGGRLEMFSSPALHGADAEWRYEGSMFDSNRTILSGAYLTQEFVTIDYVGGFIGDPKKGKTRIFFNNVGGNGGGVGCCSGTTGYFLGHQENGSKFKVDFHKDYSMGMVDWGAFSPKAQQEEQQEEESQRNSSISSRIKRAIESLSGTSSRGFSMARTLGSTSSNYVSARHTGRRVMVGWLSHDNGAAAMTTARDLSLDDEYHLIQRFVPELQRLRNPNGHDRLTQDLQVSQVQTMQGEIVAHFTWDRSSSSSSSFPPPFGVSVFLSGDGSEATRIFVDLARWLVLVDATKQKNNDIRAGPIQFAAGQDHSSLTLHVIFDHSIIQLIANDITALTVSATPSSADCARVQLFGVGQGVTASVELWDLHTANDNN